MFGGNLTFGATTSSAPPAFGATSAAPTFGQTTTPAPSSLFGNVPSSTGFSFASTPAPALGSTAAPSLFGGTSAPSLGFGTSAPNLSVPPPSFGTTTTFSLGATPASSAGTTFGFGGAGLQSTGLLGAQPVSAAAPVPASTGLGGASFGGSGQGAAKSKQDSASAAKENKLENEIMATVDNFRQYVKNQKLMREEITRASEKPIEKISDETSEMTKILNAINSGISRNMTIANKLKSEVAKELESAEMAQRTHDTPQGLQMENTAPIQFFFNLVEEFERKLLAYRQQIDEAARNLQSVNQVGTRSTRDLVDAVRKLHESFVSLASRLYSIHQQVQALRENALTNPRVGLRDFTNQNIGNRNFVSDMSSPLSSRQAIGLMGPSPFSGGIRSASKTFLDRTVQSGSFAGPPTVGLGQTLGSPLNFGGFGSSAANVSTFGSSNPNADSLQASFKLNSPPGTKRGKR